MHSAERAVENDRLQGTDFDLTQITGNLRIRLVDMPSKNDLDRLIIQNHGSLYEGDVFSLLRSSSHVIRSFEFALADGALSCADTFHPDTSFADRFWRTDQACLAGQKLVLILFDIKARTSQMAGFQQYLTRSRQQKYVAFYIGVCTADTRFVELVPNLQQSSEIADDIRSDPNLFGKATGEDDWSTEGDSDDASDSDIARSGPPLSVNTSRRSKLRPSAYWLDPSNSPYRMPVSLLHEAVNRVLHTCLTGDEYVNPWTMVAFPHWKPATVDKTDMLKPIESSDHFSAYEAVMEIYRAIESSSSELPLKVDFMGLQPRVADFKIVVKQSSNAPASSSPEIYLDGYSRQYFVQHKLDARDRPLNAPLERVAIARGIEEECRWYFANFDRFDFLFYQFNLTARPDPRPHRVCYFLPECVIPDDFYTTLEKEVSFDIPKFQAYRIVMDNEGHWASRILQVILQNQEPRQVSPRPTRIIEATASSNLEHCEELQPILQTRNTLSSGRGRYASVMTQQHNQFFWEILMQCAMERRGLIFALSSDHPMGDFGFCDYTWTDIECLKLRKSSTTPRTIHELPAETCTVPLYYFVNSVECDFRGPVVTAPQFRRLNSCANSRFVLWNLYGLDGQNQSSPLSIIPSDDLHPTLEQRDRFSENLKVKKKEKHVKRSPQVSHLLNSGLLAADYNIGKRGPLIYSESAWHKLWQFFIDAASTQEEFKHPAGYRRDIGRYRCSLQDIHTRLIQEHK
ncbi:uncharacterized protein KY384_002680 [Bacidia gigantensis]|uniref:uncharacterized protein n=1 Tax=Bacidia gigantensis TaxID=2732470 RepID=UPI001D03FFE0|nr:uncharacterized protein KY384_002680 [Bacidia gigantensis]KAG8532802.1 hypothetical protein KY384_002680 [Bacidia gigantensis]